MSDSQEWNKNKANFPTNITYHSKFIMVVKRAIIPVSIHDILSDREAPNSIESNNSDIWGVLAPRLILSWHLSLTADIQKTYSEGGIMTGGGTVHGA